MYFNVPVAFWPLGTKTRTMLSNLLQGIHFLHVLRFVEAKKGLSRWPIARLQLGHATLNTSCVLIGRNKSLSISSSQSELASHSALAL